MKAENWNDDFIKKSVFMIYIGANDYLNFTKNLALWVTIAVILVVLFNLFQGSSPRGPETTIAYSDFLQQVDQKNIDSVTIQGPNISGRKKDGSVFSTYAPSDPNLVTVGVNANGQLTDLGLYGAPGTARKIEIGTQTGGGWEVGRWGDGTFTTGNTTLTLTATQGVHYVAQTPVTALPTSGGVQYIVTLADKPTFTAASGPAVTASTLALNLGVLFGSTPKFGYDGTLAITAGGADSQIAFSTAGGYANPSLTNVLKNGQQLRARACP